LVEHKKVIIVGIPGVGKSTVVTKVVEILKEKNKTVSMKSFGTVMLEQANKNGIHDRDELRKAPVEIQQKLQTLAAKSIGQMNDDVVIIDTHAFISTKEGFYPGLPKNVLENKFTPPILLQYLQDLKKFTIEEWRIKQEVETLYQ